MAYGPAAGHLRSDRRPYRPLPAADLGLRAAVEYGAAHSALAMITAGDTAAAGKGKGGKLAADDGARAAC